VVALRRRRPRRHTATRRRGRTRSWQSTRGAPSIPRRNLLALRLANLRLAHGDGYAGLEQAAPFHSVIVAAAAPRVPEALARQLAPDGRMILPLATAAGGQRLLLIERRGRSYLQSELDPVYFVPMTAGKA